MNLSDYRSTVRQPLRERLRNAFHYGLLKVTGKGHGAALVTVEHRNAAGELLHRESRVNQITNAGRVFIHTQAYSAAPGGNGLNFIALTNDSGAPAAGDTTLASEITTNGLARASGTVTLASGSGNVTTVAKTFTATGTQSAQKAALFTASSSGTMAHELAFTARSLISGDTLTITFSITLG